MLAPTSSKNSFHKGLGSKDLSLFCFSFKEDCMKYKLKRFLNEVINACLVAAIIAELSILSTSGFVCGYMRGAGLG